MNVREYFQRLQKNLLDACVEFYGDRLKGLLIFGSVARDTMTPDSDLDFLLLVDPLPNGRWQRAREFDAVEQGIKPLLDELDSVGIWGAGFLPSFEHRRNFVRAVWSCWIWSMKRGFSMIRKDLLPKGFRISGNG
jgi:predicted nucleotidyltransferase